MFEVSFSQASRLNSFFLLVSALLRLVQWFVEVLYKVKFVLSFCLFVFPLVARLSEVVTLSAADWVCIFVWFVVQMRLPAQGATGGWVMPGLVFQWFPLCEFSLFDTPKD